MSRVPTSINSEPHRAGLSVALLVKPDQGAAHII